VRVRFLADAGFARTYPETLARLDAHASIAVRTLDLRAVGLGGVLHEKAFVIDGEEAWLGSQNFDWRSLTHIQELGVFVRDPVVARALTDVFESDWALAGGTTRRVISKVRTAGYGFGPGLALVASPRDLLPDESLWDLPHLLAWIDGARRSIRVQLLTFGDDEGRWPVLSGALRRAAARGVRVELAVSNWALRPKPRAALARLLAPGLTVKIATIPPARGGFIPFARVVHAKYMVVDGARAWIGTSNWEREYFHASRNVGLLVERPSVARRLEAFFRGLWSSAYAETFDPRQTYPAPRIAE
jgi:phosphatidylserine/phosphatidylglycerophosphate/cardiolipin synthase-like enzyme